MKDPTKMKSFLLDLVKCFYKIKFDYLPRKYFVNLKTKAFLN